jgi:hypothetical protein
VVSDTVWTGTTATHNGRTIYTKKACFSTGNGTTTFRMPLLTNAMISITTDGNVKLPGLIEYDQVGQYTLTLPRANHTASDTNIGVTDGPQPGSPNDTKSYTINSGVETKVERRNLYALMKI